MTIFSRCGTWVRCAGLAAGLALAGCSSSGGSGADGGTSSDGKPATTDGAAKSDGARGDGAVKGDAGATGKWTGGKGGKTGSYEFNMDFGGNKRLIAVYVPSGYSEKKGVPLILHFHGWRPPPAEVLDEIKYVWGPVADAKGFIAVAPEGLPCPELNPKEPYACFREESEGPFLKALVESLGKQYNLDLQRIYLSGHSGGGYFVQGMGLMESTLYAAVMVWSGGCISAKDIYGNSCSEYDKLAKVAKRKIPFSVAHNGQDQIVPVQYGADMLQVLQKYGHTTTAFDMVNGGKYGHSIDPDYPVKAWEWVSKHVLP
ncbi:MAG: hypothetical protein IT371_17135 [Deltaproteobacteria bacterium]|nr:hypothetical protein [Deltaproteobacteria bacterium]